MQRGEDRFRFGGGYGCERLAVALVRFRIQGVETGPVELLAFGRGFADEKIQKLRRVGIVRAGMAVDGGHEQVAEMPKGIELSGGEECRCGVARNIEHGRLETGQLLSGGSGRLIAAGWVLRNSGGGISWVSGRRRGLLRFCERSEQRGGGRRGNNRLNETASFHASVRSHGRGFDSCRLRLRFRENVLRRLAGVE